MNKSLFDFAVFCIVSSIVESFGYSIVTWQWWLIILLVNYLLSVSDWFYNIFNKKIIR